MGKREYLNLSSNEISFLVMEIKPTSSGVLGRPIAACSGATPIQGVLQKGIDHVLGMRE